MISTKLSKLQVSNPLKDSFYKDYCRLDREKKSVILIKNILLDFKSHIDTFVYKYQTLDEEDIFRGYPIFSDFSFFKKKGIIYFNLEGKKTVVAYDNIEAIVNQIWSYYFVTEKVESEEIEKAVSSYIDRFKEFILNYVESHNSEHYIPYLYKDAEDGLLMAELTNHYLTVFDIYCQSLIKAEYLLNDDFSEDYLLNKRPENKQITVTQSSILEDLHRSVSVGTNPCEDTNKEVNGSVDLFEELKNFIQEENSYFDKTSGDKSTVIETWRNLHNNLDQYLDFYTDLDLVKHEYFQFNRKIDFLYAPNQKNEIIIRAFFDSEKQHSIKYKNAVEHFNSVQWGTDMLEVSKMLPYLFRKMLDMTLVDHNFISSEENLKTLLQLDELLETRPLPGGSRNIASILNELKGKTFVNEDIINALLNTLLLIRSKNRTLIYKILKKAGKDVERITYLGENEVKIINRREGIKRFYSVIYTSDYIQNPNKNELVRKFNIYHAREKLDTSFTSLEKSFLELIYNKEDISVCQNLYSNLERKCLDIFRTSRLRNEGISAYNNVIKNNFIEHFKKYGIYIKKLNIEIERKGDINYLRELSDFLKTQNNSDILSCTFVREHIKWCIQVVESFNRKYVNPERIDIGERERIEEQETLSERRNREAQEAQEKKEEQEIFEYLSFADYLLRKFKQIITSIEKGMYVANYGNFFEDCFYKIAINEKKEIEAVEKSDNVNNSSNIIFIASTWQPPIGIDTLVEQYETLKNEKNEITAELYNTYFSSVLNYRTMDTLDKTTRKIDKKSKEVDDNLKKESDENKRSTVQILGIFAAFLSLISIGIGSTQSKNLDNMMLVKIILSMTFGVSLFVLLLHFLINKPAERNMEKMVTLGALIIAVFILLAVILFSGFLPFFSS